MSIWKPRGKIMLTWLSAVVIFWHVPGIFGWITGGHEFGGALAQAGPLEYILSGLLSLVGAISATGLSMIAYVLRPEVVTTILMGGEGEIVYVMWTMVRDLLNLAFILILLFSAFATIFQVQKYNLRSLLLKLVLMAVFVNFSLPIARVIIDASNIIMYYFINILFAQAHDPGIDVGIKIIQSMNIAEIIIPKGTETESATVLFFGVIFTLIVGIFTIAIGGILIVRLVALAILMIFSPIAFVANILPSTQNFANDWWSNLFKYAFVGPILIFFLFFSTVFMAQMNNMAFMKKDAQGAKSATSLIDTTKNIGADESSWIATISFNMIPIIILYMGIMSSMKMGGAAGTFIAGAAGGAFNKIRQGAWGAGKWAGVRTLRAADDVSGNLASGTYTSMKQRSIRKNEEYKARVEGRAADLTLASTRRAADQTRKLSEEMSKATKNLEHLSDIKLRNVIKNGENKAEIAAASKLLADRGGMTIKDMNNMSHKLGKSAKFVSAYKDVESSMKKNNQGGTLAAYYAGGAKKYDQKTGKWEKLTVEESIKYVDKSANGLTNQDLKAITDSGNKELIRELDAVIDKRVRTGDHAKHVEQSDNMDSIEIVKTKKTHLFDERKSASSSSSSVTYSDSSPMEKLFKKEE